MTKTTVASVEQGPADRCIATAMVRPSDTLQAKRGP